MHRKTDGKYNGTAGAEEGIYAWIAANYAMGTLGGNPKHTTGIIELGGASAQVLIFFFILF
jgi:apyrase